MDKTESVIMKESELTIGLATPPPKVLLTPNLGVIGVGGAGCNAVNNMVSSGVSGCSFFAANTDAQVLSKSLVADKIQLGVELTQGLGAGSNPEIGQKSAEESQDKIKECITGLHLLFLTAGMGGGTGTGAIPVIARLAKEMGILTVAVVSTPFRCEGPHRMKVALKGIEELQKYVDTMIVVPNQNLFRIAKANTLLSDAFKMSDDVLCQGVRGITDLVMQTGMINLDFADVRTALTTMGRAMMGTGTARGDNRAEVAVEQALMNPLLDNCSIKGAKSVLINVSAGVERLVALDEMDTIMQKITDQADENAVIKMGSALNESLGDAIQVCIVATGLTTEKEPVVGATVRPVSTAPMNEVKPQPTPLMVNDPEEAPPKEDLNLLPPNFPENTGPFVQNAYRPNLAEAERTVSEEAVKIPGDLFSERPPVIPTPVQVHKKPVAQEEITPEIPQTMGNVKRPSSVGILGRIPNLINMARNMENKKKEIVQPQMETDDSEDYDIPNFFKT